MALRLLRIAEIINVKACSRSIKREFIPKTKTMKKTPYFTALLAVCLLSACSDNSKETAQTEETTEMALEEPAAGTVVVEAPDYSSVAEPMQQNVNQLLEEYMKLKDALVASDPAATQTAANAIVTMANAMPVATLQPDQKDFAEERVEEVKQSASKISQSTDLSEQREHLEPLSEATFALTKAFGATDQKLYYQHCPMALNDKGAYWISTEQKIMNPYFGESMLNCGTNEEVYTNN